jgi:hypothetical protein
MLCTVESDIFVIKKNAVGGIFKELKKRVALTVPTL